MLSGNVTVHRRFSVNMFYSYVGVRCRSAVDTPSTVVSMWSWWSPAPRVQAHFRISVL